MSRYTDTELVDALEHYAWRVDAECHPDGYRYTVRVDVFCGPVLGEGRTWREALSAALDRASESQNRQGRCRPGQNDGDIVATLETEGIDLDTLTPPESTP